MSRESTIASPGGCCIAAVPMFLTLGALWWNGNLALMCWLITAAAIFNWLCAEAVQRSKADAEKSAMHFKAAVMWDRIYNIGAPIYWIFCLGTIIYALVTKQKP